MKHFKIAAVALAASLSLGNAHAAAADNMMQKTLSSIRAHADQTRWSSNDEFRLVRVIADADGSTHVRLDRRYNGLPVIGGDMVVHNAPDGSFRSASLTLRQPIALDTTAVAIKPAKAIALAESKFEGKLSGTTRADLVVYARGEEPKLAYDVVARGIRDDGTESVAHFIVSAADANVLDQWDAVHTEEATGTGYTLFSGAVTLTTDSISGGYQMLDPSRGDHYVVDLKNRIFGAGTIFTDSNNTWGDSTTSDRATVAADALYGQNKTWDYYASMFGRHGVADDGNGGYSRVHYFRNYVNAYWSDDCFCMTYGDGDGSTYLPLVTLDITGHEMTHGVTANSANLTYSGESGGINEAMSDIMGTMVEFYANNADQVPNYLIGERIYTANAGVDYPTTALRYMFKPSLDGTSPDCYQSNLGNYDVHYSSGVANHFFYLLAEGATVPTGFTGTVTKSSLVCNGDTTLTGIGRDAAARIMYRALTVYMTSNTDYDDARDDTLSAAKDLYGVTSTEYATVADAWDAVDVD